MSATPMTILITATESNGVWSVTDPGDTTVTNGQQVNFQLQSGSFFMIVVPDSKPAIFQNSHNQWFFGTTASPTSGDVAVNTGSSNLIAKYLIFWTNGSAKAHLDPKVIVKPGMGYEQSAG